MYKKVNTELNFVEREEQILKFWKENKIFEQTEVIKPKAKNFSFYDGPPTANGQPHIGHVLTRSFKDLIPRFHVMKGENVLRKAGWDTHGLPVELEVEKSLGIDGKQQIEKYGIAPFIAKCKESVWKYKDDWQQLSDRVAYWADMEHPYVTYDNDYIESEWWALKTIFDKGLLYKGYKIVPYCPRCGTALSSHEVAQGYKDVKEKSAIAKFKLKSKENVFFLAWTTTPWTLPSNVALCMNANENYSTVLAGGEYFILAEALVGKYFENAQIVETKKGKDYERVEYEPLFNYATPDKKCYYVTCDNYVTLTDGTGIVHIAPAFGEDDSRVGKLYNLPFVQLIDERGKFIEGCEELTGLFCKDADKVVLKKLKADGTLFAELAYEHSYPFCWRCDTPLIYYARKSWFIKMTAVKNDLVANNKKINWIPESIGSGRMGNFLENVIDWGISRDRYWGTPLPIWVCPDCGEVKVIGSRAELSKLSGCPEDIELHRPMLDDVTISCSKCGGVMRRTPEVIDCWFDSGSMPYAQFHYPFENKDLFEKNFPADFISEAVDQTRGWFYTLSAISTLLFNKPAFKNCIVLGLVGDEFGVKMSKHKGNGFDPWKAFNKQGADAVRWYFYTSSAPWLPSRFYDEAVSEVQRRFLGTLWNTYAFFVLYAEIDKFNPSKHTLKDCKLSEMDRWVLSELNTLIIDTDKHLTNYEVTEAARGLESFVDNLSNWYVRRCRERYWGSEWTEDKQAAYVTLYTVLLTFTKLCAPFVPFISEEIYQNLVPQFYPNEPKSVHLCSYPVADKSYIDNGLNVGMEEVLKIVVLGRSARNSANIKNRQPLARMFVFSPKLTKLPENLQKIVLGELNIKELSYTADLNRFITYSLKPQLRTLGPKYGKHLNAIREHLFALGDKTVELVNTLRKGEKYHIVLDNEAVELSEEDLLITSESTRGYQSVTDNGITVVLDTTLTPELVEEGIERELISKIQTLRKDNGFNVVDHIIIQIETDIDTLGVVTKYSDDIRKDTLSDRIDIVTGGLPAEPIDINGHSVKLILSVVK